MATRTRKTFLQFFFDFVPVDLSICRAVCLHEHGKTDSKTDGKTDGRTGGKTDDKTVGKIVRKTEGKTSDKTHGDTYGKMVKPMVRLMTSQCRKNEKCANLRTPGADFFTGLIIIAKNIIFWCRFCGDTP